VSADLDWRRAWTGVLDQLELNVADVEALLADNHRQRDLPPADPWSPPAGLGPMPLDLRPRADEVLARQLAAARAVAGALATTRQQAAVASRMLTDRAPQRPAYVDCAM
jgi:hypothetical protein